MRSICILTFWNVPNYGAFLQAYSLQRVLQNQFNNYDVKQISYLNKKHFRAYYSVINTNFPYWVINPYFYKSILYKLFHYSELKSTKKFVQYYNAIPHTDPMTSKILRKREYDIVILGSDIIWDYSIPFFGKDDLLFGNHICAKRKIAYAPSFGMADIDKGVPAYVIDGLNNLNNISVRDEKSKEIIKRLTGKEVPIVLDPTLLWNFDLDNNVNKPNVEYSYIVVYGSFFAENLIKEACSYCQANNLKLICLSSLDDTFDWCDVVINQDQLTPFQWLGYFKYAEAVMTCTYHGLLFGLIFKKKIIFHMTEFIMNKAARIISALNLEDVIIDKKGFREKINWDWDYSIIEHRINKLKEQSMNYLCEAINNEY